MDFESTHFTAEDLEIKDVQNRLQQLVDSHKWLSAADYRSDHIHLLMQRSHLLGTSLWLFGKKEMISWQDSRSNDSIFWFHGILGSGIC